MADPEVKNDQGGNTENNEKTENTGEGQGGEQPEGEGTEGYFKHNSCIFIILLISAEYLDFSSINVHHEICFTLNIFYFLEIIPESLKLMEQKVH